MYGFHKIPHLQQGVLRSDSDTEPWHFEHPHFHRGQPDLLCLIQRKKQPPHGTGEDTNMEINEPTHVPPPISNLTAGQVLDINSVLNGISAIKRHQQAISSDLNELKSSNQHLWQEALAARERHKRHQDTINRILKFLAGVFGRNGDNEDKHEGHSDASPRAVVPRKRQRLMIGDGSNTDKSKATMVEEIDDDEDDRRKSYESSQGSNRFSTGMLTITPEDRHNIHSIPEQYPRIDTPGSSIRGTSVGPPEVFSPTPSEISNGMYNTPQPLRPAEVISRSSTAEPPNNNHNLGPTNTPTSNGPSIGPLPPPSPSSLLTSQQESAMWGPALQQLLSSPASFQRILQALQQNYPMAAPSDPTIPSACIQPADFNVHPSGQPALQHQMTPYDPNAYDFSRFRTDLPSGSGQVTNPTASSLHLLGPEDDGPSLEPLMQNAQQLHKTYQDAHEIDADVDALHTSINSLIENLGLDPTTMADHEDPILQASSTNPDISIRDPAFGSTSNGLNSSASSIPTFHQPSSSNHTSSVPSVGLGVGVGDGIMSSDPAAADFDFEAFLNTLDAGNPTGDMQSYSPRFDPVGSMDGMGGETTAESLPAFLDELSGTGVAPPAGLVGDHTSTTTGGGGNLGGGGGGTTRKRKSDVAELPIPTVTPIEVSSTSPKVKRKR